MFYKPNSIHFIMLDLYMYLFTMLYEMIIYL